MDLIAKEVQRIKNNIMHCAYSNYVKKHIYDEYILYVIYRVHGILWKKFV